MITPNAGKHIGETGSLIHYRLALKIIFSLLRLNNYLQPSSYTSGDLMTCSSIVGVNVKTDQPLGKDD